MNTEYLSIYVSSVSIISVIVFIVQFPSLVKFIHWYFFFLFLCNCKQVVKVQSLQYMILRQVESPMKKNEIGSLSFFFISWRLITLQYYSGFCHTVTRISPGFTCIPHPYPPSHLPLHPIPLGLPSAPGPSTCLMHPAWAGVDPYLIPYTKIN